MAKTIRAMTTKEHNYNNSPIIIINVLVCVCIYTFL